jgi:hypothetical protein
VSESDSSRRLAELSDEIIRKGQRRAKILTTMRGAVLWKIGDRFEREIGIGDQVSERQQ